jgi:hypothetical protein
MTLPISALKREGEIESIMRVLTGKRGRLGGRKDGRWKERRIDEQRDL